MPAPITAIFFFSADVGCVNASTRVKTCTRAKKCDPRSSSEYGSRWCDSLDFTPVDLRRITHHPTGASVIQAVADNVTRAMNAVTVSQQGRSNVRAAQVRGAKRSLMAVSGAQPGSGLPGLSALIVAIAERGDRSAFATLFNHFAPRVKSYMLRLGADAQLAEELAQETMLTVWRRADGFDPARAAASTWIFTIARNLRIDAARRGQRMKHDDPFDESIAPDLPDAILSAAQDETRVASAIGQLPQDQARVIREAFFSDKPHSEIAAELGLPLGTVKSRLRLAMARLRGLLGEAA